MTRRGVASDGLLHTDWWRDSTLMSTRLRDLVAGFDTIEPFAIPYARLPRRLGTYAEEFPRWADVADQTPESLMLRPRVAEAAVRALIEAAQRAVRVHRDTIAAGPVGADAAVARLLGELDDFDREMLAGQVWAPAPVSQRVLAERLGVNPVSISRNLPRARARFAELLADPAHHEVGEHADHIRQRLGPYLPVDAAELEMRRLGVDPAGQTAAVLLHIAGPYTRRRGGWIEAGGSHARALAAVEAVFDTQGAPTTDTLLHTLRSLGLSTGVAMTLLETELQLRRFGDLWVRWPSDTAVDMAVAVLHLLGAPATADTIYAMMSPHDANGVSMGHLTQVLSAQDRFVRASRTT